MAGQLYDIAMGFVVAAGAYSSGGISMRYFNLAVAFGINVSRAHLGFGNCPIYTVFEFIDTAQGQTIDPNRPRLQKQGRRREIGDRPWHTVHGRRPPPHFYLYFICS